MPHQFLREAPLVDGDWIDNYMVELAEWGARIREREFLLEEPEDNHPMAWHGINRPEGWVRSRRCGSDKNYGNRPGNTWLDFPAAPG